jgi:hypothetical protein
MLAHIHAERLCLELSKVMGSVTDDTEATMREQALPDAHGLPYKHAI